MRVVQTLSMNVRCYTCNMPLAHLEQSFETLKAQKANTKHALDVLGIMRMCCRTAFITKVPVALHCAVPRVDQVTDNGATTILCVDDHCRTFNCNDGSIM